MALPKSSELAAALDEIRLRGLDGVALVAPFPLDAADLDELAAAPAVRWVGQRGAPVAGSAGAATLCDDVGGGVPDGVLHIFFLGSWRDLPPLLRRRARQLRVTSLLCRVGGVWRHPPTPSHIAKGLYYKLLFHPLLAPIGRVFASAGRGLARYRAAVVRRFDQALLSSRMARLHRTALSLARRDQPGLVLALGFPLPVEDVDSLLALPGLAGLMLPGGVAAEHPRLGSWSNGAWSLPAEARQVFVVGSWSMLGGRALVAAVEQRLERLVLPLGPFWLPLPLTLLSYLLKAYRYAPNPWLTAGLFRRVLAGAGERSGFVPGRVVLVCGSLAPGGAERQVANTLLGLAGAGLTDIRLLCDFLTPGQASRYDFYLPPLRAAGIAAREIVPALTRVDPADPRLPKAFRRAAKHIPAQLAVDVANLYLEFRALKPEVVHAFLDWSSVRAGMAAALAGVPRIVLSGRNVNPSHFALYQRYMDPVYQVLAERPEVSLVNNSEAGARDYEDWLGLRAGQIGVLRNGVAFPDGRAPPARIRALRAELGVPDDAPLIGGMFRLYPEKRPMLWVEAAAEVARRRPDVRFVIWGQGILEQELRAQIRALGLADRLVLAGMTADTPAALSALDLFMLTSIKEGTPNVVLEAQWVGTPVVAVEAGGTREALDVGRTGWIVEPPTPSALADRVSALLDEPEHRAKCLAAGPAFIEARFGFDRMIEETLAAYGFDARLGRRRRVGER